MHFSIGEENGTAASFTAYIELLISIGWVKPGDVLVMDNAAIHTGGEAAIVADILWKFAQVVIVPLQTRVPELNPIELIFQIRIRPAKKRLWFVRVTGRDQNPCHKTTGLRWNTSQNIK